MVVPQQRRSQRLLLIVNGWRSNSPIGSSQKTPLTMEEPLVEFHSLFVTVCSWCFLSRPKVPKTKKNFPSYYDAKQVRISQEKRLFMVFPLSYQLTSNFQSAH